MAYTTIDDPSVYFQTALYSSDGGGGSITVTNDGNSDLQPDWIWIKVRNGANDHNMFDSSRSNFAERQWSNLDSASDSTVTVSANSDGFATGTGYGDINNTSGANNYVAWQWKANGGTATATGSESGNNPAYSVQANTTAGFSIVTYTGTGAAGTVPHGLGAVPSMILVKNRTSGSTPWTVYHKNSNATPQNYILVLNTTAAASDNDRFNDTAPTSSVFSVNDSASVNENSSNHLAYCFTEKQGYSKFGSYTGNGNADGPFVYTGFKPAWVILKRSSGVADWNIFDNKRPNAFNEANGRLRSNDATAESTSDAGVDLLSNGFKCRLGSEFNANGTTNIYMAFAESPFVSSEGVPTTAR